MTPEYLVLTRAVHFGACLLLFGIYGFDRFTVSVLSKRRGKITGYWENRLRIISLVLLPVILVSGMAWFALVAIVMSGQPLQMAILKIVWEQTQFGTVWKFRVVFLAVIVIAVLISGCIKSRPHFQTFILWFLVLASGCLVGSLAWAGHGRESSPWHLFADVLHLLAAGLWPGGLLPLFLILRRARLITEPTTWLSVAVLVRRFSTISLAAVSILAVTGLVNGWFLVGSIPNLLGQPYGRWLLAKIIFFGAALTIAAINLLYLKPRLLGESLQPEKAEMTAGQLKKNVALELVLGSMIIIIVAVLGILPPAIHGGQ